MQRDLDRLSSAHFDLLVVGGGVYGLICACDAARRGLRVALVERGDFGAATSFNHLRTIHGGLRYLQTLDLARARESIAERRTLAQIAPSAVAPLAFVLPLSPSLSQGPLAMRAGFLLDRLIAGDRNDGVPQRQALPAGTVLSPADAARRFPVLSGRAIAGAAVWYDYVTIAPDRLTFAWAADAVQHGAVLANYVEAAALVIDSGHVIGVQARDRRSAAAFTVRARTVVNATGAAVDRLPSLARSPIGLPMIHAMNLITSLNAPDHALGGRTAQGRTLFMVPWNGRAVFGTWESDRLAAAGEPLRAGDITFFLAEINEAFPDARLSLRDVTRVQHGVVPAVRSHAGRFHLDGGERIQDHAVEGLTGLISVAGTKYTTARRVAERVVDLAVERLGVPALPCTTAHRPLAVVLRGTDDENLESAVRDEMVETLEDAVMRRTGLATLGHPGRAALEHAAAVVGNRLGWNGEQRDAEIAAVERAYGTSNALNT